MAAAAREGGAARYVSHVRDEGDRLLPAIEEAIAVGRLADVAVQCSHHKAAGKRNWGKVHASLELIDRARSQGQPVAADVYPYVAMWTDLATILPEDTRDGGTAKTLERLWDPPTAAAVALALNLAHGDEWHDMLVTDVATERNAAVAGMRLDDIARMRRRSPALTAIELLREEELQVQAAFFNMSEDDVATVIGTGFVCIGSDASAIADRGVSARGVPHPRTFGCFPRVFGRFVRQRHALDLPEAIRRMTSLPAALFGLAERGTLTPGAYADLVVFDPETIVDTATYERPYQYPRGISHVFVNGVAVVRDGEPTNRRPGRVLRGGRG
jgi:N-acyl-D-amino-acid deacylase